MFADVKRIEYERADPVVVPYVTMSSVAVGAALSEIHASSETVVGWNGALPETVATFAELGVPPGNDPAVSPELAINPGTPRVTDVPYVPLWPFVDASIIVVPLESSMR
jgi:hypothetical protein